MCSNLNGYDCLKNVYFYIEPKKKSVYKNKWKRGID